LSIAEASIPAKATSESSLQTGQQALVSSGPEEPAVSAIRSDRSDALSRADRDEKRKMELGMERYQLDKKMELEMKKLEYEMERFRLDKKVELAKISVEALKEKSVGDYDGCLVFQEKIIAEYKALEANSFDTHGIVKEILEIQKKPCQINYERCKDCTWCNSL
jgi:hypothetical protein